MSFSPRNERTARNSSAAWVAGEARTSEGARGLFAPMPGILESFDLGISRLAGWAFEQDVVICLAVEWRVEIDKIDAVVGDLVAQHAEIVAIIKCVRHSAPRVLSLAQE